MNVISPCLIFLLFLLVPIVFIGTDHPTVLAPFVMPGYHYESVKVLVFFVIWAFLGIVSSSGWWKEGNAGRLSRSALLGIMLLMASIILSTVLSDFPMEALWGSPERRHGAILYGGLILLYALLRNRMSGETKKMGEWGILGSFTILAGYAFFQMCGFGLPISWYASIKGYQSVSSVLGNSAYLAGYMLILLPWILERKNPRAFRYSGGILAIMAILATGSISAIILATFYLTYIGFKEYAKPRTSKGSVKSFLLLAFMISLWGMVFFSATHPHLNVKMQNLETRLVVWHETLSVWKRDPVSMAFGNGADTLGNFLELDRRSNSLRKHIPDVFVIDRAHNILLDILFSFGIMGLLVFLIPVWMLLGNRMHHPSVHVILLFFAFFFFNIPVISHWIVFIFALSTVKMKE